MALLSGEVLHGQPMAAQRMSLAHNAAGSLPGTLFLTSLRVLWEPAPPPGATLRRLADDDDDTSGASHSVVRVHLHSIERLRKLKATGGEQGSSVVEVLQKYNARPSLRIVLAEADYSRLGAALRAHVGAPAHSSDVRADISRSFAVAHGTLAAAAGGVAGRWPYEPESEFHRQGLNNPLSHWRISRINEDYELCPTYPALLVVPRSVSDEALQKAAAFRSGRRVPVLCWKDPFGVASICRSSQPMVGVAKARSAQDEGLLQAIADTNPFVERLQIIDCRPRVNAELNKTKGKGYEHQAQYVNTKLSFMNIDNIHVMRASLRSFLQLLQPRTLATAKEEDGWWTDVEKCGWMEHIRKVLRAATLVTHLISVARSSVLVHCSDGWDRTAQVTALSQLMLDPSFRSIDGFQRLLTKEWLAFGHQFALRMGILAPLEPGGHSARGPA